MNSKINQLESKLDVLAQFTKITLNLNKVNSIVSNYQLNQFKSIEQNEWQMCKVSSKLNDCNKFLSIQRKEQAPMFLAQMSVHNNKYFKFEFTQSYSFE